MPRGARERETWDATVLCFDAGAVAEGTFTLLDPRDTSVAASAGLSADGEGSGSSSGTLLLNATPLERTSF